MYLSCYWTICFSVFCEKPGEESGCARYVRDSQIIICTGYSGGAVMVDGGYKKPIPLWWCNILS